MPVPVRAPEPKKVVVTVIPAVGITVSPDPFRISKTNREEVEWVGAPNPAASFVVCFDETPFNAHDFHSGPHARSGRVRDDVKPNSQKVYKYTVTANGYTLDPGGIIDP